MTNAKFPVLYLIINNNFVLNTLHFQDCLVLLKIFSVAFGLKLSTLLMALVMLLQVCMKSHLVFQRLIEKFISLLFVLSHTLARAKE